MQTAHLLKIIESVVWNTVRKTTRKVISSVSNTGPEFSEGYSLPGTEVHQKNDHPSHPEMSCGAKVAQKPEHDPANKRKNKPDHNGTQASQAKS